MIVELKKGTVPGLANRLSLFEQVSKHLIRYIDWPKFEHCLSARLVHGPKLITKKNMAKSFDMAKSLCAKKYMVCYVLAQIMVVNSFMAHLYVNKPQCSSQQKVPSEAWKFYFSR